jgi:hypothetical protein
MALITVVAGFRPFPAEVTFKQKVKIRPNVHYYNKDGSYVKYTCQICEQVVNGLNGFLDNDDERFVNFSLSEGIEQCPCCGINIDWDFLESEVT